MATARLVCPHCGRVDRQSVSGLLDWVPQGRRNEWLESLPLSAYGFDAVCGLKCHLCGGWSIGVFSASGGTGSELLKGGPTKNNPVESSGAADLVRVYPPQPIYSVHSHVPEPARVFFVEALEDLRSRRSPAGVISKCRSVLDLCLKHLEAAGTGRKARIADLRAKGVLTQGLADWADELWDDGNDAIHDLTGDANRAAQHVKFLELFFEVVFALPAQVAAAKTPASPP